MAVHNISSSVSYSGYALKGGQKTTAAAGTAQAQQEHNGAVEAFLNLAKMGPPERLRAAYLKEKNLTEESLAALPKDERLKIEESIRQLIEQKYAKGRGATGSVLDMSV